MELDCATEITKLALNASLATALSRQLVMQTFFFGEQYDRNFSGGNMGGNSKCPLKQSKLEVIKKAVVDRFGRKDWENATAEKLWIQHYAVYLEKEGSLLIQSFKSSCASTQTLLSLVVLKILALDEMDVIDVTL